MHVYNVMVFMLLFNIRFMFFTYKYTTNILTLYCNTTKRAMLF